MKNSLIRITAIVLGLFGLVSCDKDFNSLDSDVLGDDHFDLLLKEDVSVVAYSKATGDVQSNNLEVNALGIYNNPVFGTTKAHFVTQLELNSVNPVIGDNVEIKPIDSVYLFVPYFSTSLNETDSDGNNLYELDSIYGDENSSFNLKIYENGYVIRDFSPNVDPNDINSYTQKYYTNDRPLIESNIIGSQLNLSSNSAENTDFKFNKNEIVFYKKDADGNYINNSGDIVTDPDDRVVKKRVKPGMWINLDKDFFKTKVLLAGQNNLLNNTIFKQYFKGLYFKVEANSGQDGAMAMLDFSAATISIQYHSDITTTTNGVSTTKNSKKEVKLNLSGNTISFLEHVNSLQYQMALDNSNSVDGDERLYLKGGNGSVAYIDLFGADVDGDDVPDQLEELRANGWMINEANLVFYIDNNVDDGMGQSAVSEPRRIYLYDATNNKPLIDYTYDGSTSSDSKNNKSNFGGIMTFEDIEDEDGERGISYKIRITQYINRIINNEDPELNKNVTLGLCVTESISASSNAFLKTPINFASQQTKFVPVGNNMSPLGTILYGSHADVPEAKKLKLQIFYTKPN